MNQKVTSVSSVCFNIEKSNPPQLSLHAIGKVNSSGWKNPSLAQRVYVAQPQDGIQDFDFYAAPPIGNVLWVISPVSVDTTIILEKWMQGVRVHSSTNSVVVNLSDVSCSVPLGALSNQVLRKNYEDLSYFKRMDGDGGGADPAIPNPPDLPRKELPNK